MDNDHLGKREIGQGKHDGELDLRDHSDKKWKVEPASQCSS